MSNSMLGPKIQSTARRDLPTGQPRAIHQLDSAPPKKFPRSAPRNGAQKQQL
jgi:hypothetical protein